MIQFKFNDGGRADAGYQGTTGDCVARAIAIVTGNPYQEVYDTLASGNATQRKSKHHKAKDGIKTASRGISTNRKWFQDYMESIGFEWTPTMLIGQGCKVHLKADELPKGKLVVAVSKHYTAVIDGVVNDIYDPSRQGTRCVYGYYTYIGKPKETETIYSHTDCTVCSGKGFFGPVACVACKGYGSTMTSFEVTTETKKEEVIEQPKSEELKKYSEKLNKLISAKKKWETKLKRAENAIKKLNKKINYYNNKTK